MAKRAVTTRPDTHKNSQADRKDSCLEDDLQPTRGRRAFERPVRVRGSDGLAGVGEEGRLKQVKTLGLSQPSA